MSTLRNAIAHVDGKLHILGGCIFSNATNKQVGTVYQRDDHQFAINGDRQDEANAAEIVHRYNCHDELLAALERYHRWHTGTSDEIDTDAMEQEARAAIAQAKGTP